MCKLDQNELGMVEELHNNGLRTKDIYNVLASVSSKYVHKYDIYNAVSHQYQQKLQELNEIEMLLKTLQNNKNIMTSMATKPAYNDEHDQDGSFIQAIFWAHQNAFSEFAIAKNILIIDMIYKTNRLLATIQQKHQEHIYKIEYETFLYQNRHIQDDKDIGLEKLHSVCSQFAFETYIKKQRDLVISGEYGVLKHDDNLYDIVQIGDQVYNPLSDGHCGFRSLAIAIFQEEKK
ncbi:7425_t:CDS:2 [Cetraspora pellucida]|uniref:7425_t:CDS:1 n=1 Tax=Cetraspora pellucida TaxID=1433469 RepID=A0A9N8ZCB4_9GLOM|nr:7425_t:CDS:2 [Cetraspora pellucida]